MRKLGSVKPRKQRKLAYNAPAHIRHAMLAAPLSPELRQKYNTRSLPVRRGDTVRILRGDFAGTEGKVRNVDTKKLRLHIEGVTRETAEGKSSFIPVHSSKVMITKLNLDDKWRREVLESRFGGVPSEDKGSTVKDDVSKPVETGITKEA
ncbi:50S ribosomal protein L24 [Candidatus Bathyarchaeota archaeon]|nr:50S ribosomal protein L24 [Candidatus Bathyarchaeota archaeon]